MIDRRVGVRRRVLLAGAVAAAVGSGAFAAMYPSLRDRWDDLDPLLPTAPAGGTGTPDGWVVVSYGDVARSYVLNPDTGDYASLPGPWRYGDTSPDLRYAVVHEEDPSPRPSGLVLYDIVTGRIRRRVPVASHLVRWSPDGRHLAALRFEESDPGAMRYTVTFIEVTTGRTTVSSVSMPREDSETYLSMRWLSTGGLVVPPLAGAQARARLITPNGAASVLPRWPGSPTAGSVVGGDFVVLKDKPRDAYDVYTRADPRTGQVLARYRFEQVLPEAKDADEIAWLAPDRILFREGTTLYVRDIPQAARRPVGELPELVDEVTVMAARGLPPAVRQAGAITIPATVR